jgi:hypothetical protein
MFDYSFHPYLRWLRGRSQDDGPGLDIDRDGLPPQPWLSHTGNFPTPESQALSPSAPSTGLAGFMVEQPNEVPGFRVGLQNDEPGRERTWPNGMETAAPESANIAQTLGLPPGVKEPDPPAPSQLPEWLHKVVTMPVPQLSTAVDPRTGRRIVPYEPLIGPVRSYLTANQSGRRSDDALAYVEGTNPLPDPDSAEAPSAERWPSSDTPIWPADINAGPGTATARHADPEPIPEAVTGNAWPLAPMDGWPYPETDGIRGELAWPAVVTPQPAGAAPVPSVGSIADSNFILTNAGDIEERQAERRMPLPQNQPTELTNPVSPTGLAKRPPEHRDEQALSRAFEDHRHATAAQIEELVGTIATFGSRIYEDSILKAKDDLARLAERLRNDPGETVLSILNSFPQTRVEGKFVGGLAAVLTILANAKRGLEFERAVLHALNAASHPTKINKNTSKIAVEGLGRSVPDVLQRGIREIKSGVEIDNSLQLKVQAAYAQLFRIPFSLIVSPATQRISKSVRDAVEMTGGTIQRFDPATGMFTPFK